MSPPAPAPQVRVLESTSDVTTQEFAVYALQSILQDDADRHPPGARLFDALPPDVQPIVLPYLSSRFTFSGKEMKEMGVVFGTEPNLSFRRWLDLWLRRLIKAAAGCPLHHAFQACVGLLKWDLPLMTFMLPYVVQHVVSGGDEAVQGGVLDEILATVQAAAGREAEAVPELELFVQALFTLLDVLQASGWLIAAPLLLFIIFLYCTFLGCIVFWLRR